MKQVYAVGPFAAQPSVVAASTGVRPDDLATVLESTEYPVQPPDTFPPTQLALLRTLAGRLLVHVVPVGERLVVHALVELPTSADAHAAILTWGSPQWQRQVPDATGELPDLPYLPVADALDDDRLKAWLSTPTRRDLLEWVFAALLATPASTRVVVAASADDMAQVVYAVTRSFPPGLLDDFTFSTFEPNPAGCVARLIGTDPAQPLADGYFALADGFAACDPARERWTKLPEVPFAPFAATAIASKQLSRLDEVKALWQRLGLTDPRYFDQIVRLSRGAGSLTKDEATEGVQHPSYANWLAVRPEVVNQFLDWALEDRAFATGAFSRVVQVLRQKPETLTKLGQSVRDQGLQALKDGDQDRTANALEVVLPMVAPTKAGGIWGELLGQLTDPDTLPWPMRGYLLPKFARYRQQQGTTGVDPALDRWLSVPPDRLREVLALDLPRPYHVAAGRACLQREGEPNDDLARVLGEHPSLSLTLLRPETTNEDRVVALFGKLLAVAPRHPWLDDVVGSGDDFPPATRNRFLDTTLAAGTVDADRLVRTQGDRLLALFAGQPSLDKLAAQFLATPPDDLLRARPVLDFLNKLRDDSATSTEVKARIGAVQTAHEYLQKPTFTAEGLAGVASALRTTPPALPSSAKGETFTAVAAELARRADGDDFQANLESTLQHLGPVLANDPADLCENLLRDLRSRIELGRQPGPTTAFLAVALGAAKSPELDGKLDGLDGPAFALAADAAQRGGRKLLDEIDRRTTDWPRQAKAQWGFLRTAVRPQGVKRYLRDFYFFVLGTCFAVIGWYAWTQFGR